MYGRGRAPMSYPEKGLRLERSSNDFFSAVKNGWFVAFLGTFNGICSSGGNLEENVFFRLLFSVKVSQSWKVLLAARIFCHQREETASLPFGFESFLSLTSILLLKKLKYASNNHAHRIHVMYVLFTYIYRRQIYQPWILWVMVQWKLGEPPSLSRAKPYESPSKVLVAPRFLGSKGGGKKPKKHRIRC